MDTIAQAVLLCLCFAGSHVVLATASVRDPLVRRLGERGFRALFSAVASVLFTLTVVFYADHRDVGPPGPALGRVPFLGGLLVTSAVAGIVLMAASMRTYTGGHYDPVRPGTRGPRGVERVTRHPFMVGLALFAGAHALLATRLVGMVFMLTLATLATLGPVHQDAKLRRLRGRPFADYLAVTSTVPFAAILQGRQRLAWRELPLGFVTVGLVAAALLRRAHDALFAARGLWVVLVVVGGAVVILAVSERRARRLRAPLGTATRPVG
jgi:uncharacterized membrane protein